MKTIKGILINPFDKTVSEVNVQPENIKQIQELIHAEYFDVANLSNGDACYVDDMGLVSDSQEDEEGFVVLFKTPLYGTFLAGRGLILGCNSMGESIDCKTKFDDLYVVFSKGTLKK